VRQAQEAAKAAREARRTEMGAALTPEQREELKSLKEARRACREPRR
jgi:Spy/CpxP family protein refolding chaperone